jgi:hypothetical protein
MFALTIATLVLGFVAGVYLSARFLPPLAGSREGVLMTWTVRVLVGSAVAWAAVTIYDMIHAYAVHAAGEVGVHLTGIDKAEVLKSTVGSILVPDALLVGFAAVIYLLAPTDEALDELVS